MDTSSADATPSSGDRTGRDVLLWTTAAAVAGMGAWLLYDALPGINWVLWSAAAAGGLQALARSGGTSRPPLVLLTIAPIVIAGAAAVTSSPPLLALICVSVVFFLAIQMLLTAGVPAGSITLRFAATAPPVALWIAAAHALRRAVEATDLIRSSRARAWVRGLALTLPVLVAFALLLAGADPVFARWRDAIADLVANWDFVPRAAFFLVLLVIVLGAYAFASAAPATPVSMAARAPVQWLGSTERLILLGGVASLFWLFLAVQVGYLFGNLPSIPASGVTFAEYARRGFGELSVVASASALIIVVSERHGSDDGRERALRVLTFAVIAAVLLLLASAFRRVWLYEVAYGFTTARLYAQVYMTAVGAGLVMLSLEVARDFDAGRLFRRAAGAATMLFIALIYWNHEAWIARRNIDRFASTEQLDIAYLTKGLSPDAIPAIVEGLPSIPEPARSELQRAVMEQYAAGPERRDRRWFEWNLAGSRARRALKGGVESP